MAERSTPVASAANSAGRFREAVCIEAERIFDSCSDKDCLEDLQVFFPTAAQQIVDHAAVLKIRSVHVLDVGFEVEPVPFNRGFYAVDMTFYFKLTFAAYTAPTSRPVEIAGLAYHPKRVILFGSEGGVRNFRSDGVRSGAGALPTVSVKTADPIALECRLADTASLPGDVIGGVPERVEAAFDEELVYAPAEGSRSALVSLGLFTVIALERSVQLMIPVYDYSVPERESVASLGAEAPCDVFRRIGFPVQEFFPDPYQENGGQR